MDLYKESLKQKINKPKLHNNLMEIENRLRRLRALVHVGNWELDIKSKAFWASEEAFKLYGIEVGDQLLIGGRNGKYHE